MKAFVARSFDQKDDQLVSTIIEFMEALDIRCTDARKAKNKPVNEKVTELILSCEIFVGIFTRDKPICQESKVAWHCKPKEKCEIYTTSTWVIQESGFALGSGRHLILFVEKGVDELPKLQGNLEYIEFDRDRIEQTFTKISQMISDIKTKSSGGVPEKTSEGLSSPEETKPKEQEGQPKEEIEDKKKNAMDKVYDVLWGEKNYSKAQRIFDEETEALLDEDDRIPLRAFIFRVSHSLGDKIAFGKLEKLAQENQDNPRVIKQLAQRYKEMGEFGKAKDMFLLASKKYDITDVDKRSGLVEAYIQAAWCLALDGDLNAALVLLREQLLNPIFQEHKGEIFAEMAQMSKDKENIEGFLTYAEAALDINPTNTSLRFNLAYAYGELNNENLALLHYKKLTDTIEHGIGQNNMGWSYETLKLKGKAINSYFKAAEKKETLSMANLAHAYADAGFVNNAQEQIDKANKLASEGIQVNPRVGSAQQKIRNLTEEENKQELRILSEAEKERKFRVNYSKAFCSDKNITKNEIDGIWKTPWGKLEVMFDEANNSVEVNQKIQVEDISYSYGTYLVPSAIKAEKKLKDRLIRVTGKIENLSGKYTIKVEDSTILGNTVVHEATGYMVINADYNSIEIMEKMKDNKTEFVNWKKPAKS